MLQWTKNDFERKMFRKNLNIINQLKIVIEKSKEKLI